MRYLIVAIIGLSQLCMAQSAEKGKELFQQCIQCHGEMGEGNAEQKTPRVAGQHDWYIEISIKSFKDGSRPHPNPAVYKGLSDQDTSDLAAYLSSLK